MSTISDLQAARNRATDPRWQAYFDALAEYYADQRADRPSIREFFPDTARGCFADDARER